MKLPIPITVLTGFLGSGKTTLLKAVLAQPEMSGTAVIVNEFGEVGLDDALIETAEEETVLLPSGCVCCATRGDLVEALQRLYAQMMDDRIPELNRIVLETSGLADPAPIAHTLMTDDTLFRVFQLDGIVATFDAELGPNQLDAHYEPAKQIAVADRVVLTKVDRVEASSIDTAKQRIFAVNPAVNVVPSEINGIAHNVLAELGAFEPVATKAHAEGWLAQAAYKHNHACDNSDCTHPEHDHANPHAHEHTHGIKSFAIVFDEPLDGAKLSFVMELLRMSHGDKLLRVKGILNVRGEPLPFVVHGVQHVFYPPTTLDRWPSNDRRSKFVFITKDLDESAVREVLGGMFQAPGPLREEHWTVD